MSKRLVVEYRTLDATGREILDDESFLWSAIVNVNKADGWLVIVLTDDDVAGFSPRSLVRYYTAD